MPDSLPNPFAIADHRRKALGAFLKNRRIALNFSQAAVASKVGCDPKTISNVETGKSAVTAEILDAILDVLQATRNEIESFAESNITIGAKEFRVRTHILRGLLQGTLGYHQSLMHMHSWCAAAVADDRRQEFHQEFATLYCS